jgi:indolepyruvate ferredoxin oxidoreductase beta subunit
MDVVVAGVGGQGVLSACALIADVGLRQGLYVKTVETRGMAQRGGPVSAHVRLSDTVIYSAAIPTGEGNIILAIEPIEGLRQLHRLGASGRTVANSEPFDDITESALIEPVLQQLRSTENCLLIPATSLARQAGSPRSTNLVMLGAVAADLPVDLHHFEDALRDRFCKKGGAVIAASLQAFRLGCSAVTVA